MALALTQRARTRAVAAGAGLVLVAVGGVGLGVGLITARVAQEAEFVAMSEYSRGQLLPHRPDQVPPDLMRRIVDAVTRNGASCSNFDDHRLREFFAAFGSPDCRSALQAAGVQVINPDAYDRIDSGSLIVQPRSDGTVLVDGCVVRWRDESLSWVLSRPLGPRPGPPQGSAGSSSGVQGWVADHLVSALLRLARQHRMPASERRHRLHGDGYSSSAVLATSVWPTPMVCLKST